jgi:hypothetical protein
MGRIIGEPDRTRQGLYRYLLNLLSLKLETPPAFLNSHLLPVRSLSPPGFSLTETEVQALMVHCGTP